VLGVSGEPLSVVMSRRNQCCIGSILDSLMSTHGDAGMTWSLTAARKRIARVEYLPSTVRGVDPDAQALTRAWTSARVIAPKRTGPMTG
jgi:hypothetical protein